MSQEHHDPRTRPVPHDLRAMVRDCIKRRGPKGAATALGVSRTALLAVAAGYQALPGTLALLRAAQRHAAGTDPQAEGPLGS